MRTGLLVLVVLLSTPVGAQEAPSVPTLPALDVARLQILELAIENLSLKLDALKREADTFARTLHREGYELRKEQGQWGYRPVPPPSDVPSPTQPPPPRQE